MSSRGIYLLANDPYTEWIVALLESVRSWNPDVAIYLIPFDDRFSAVASLSDRYQLTIYDDPTLEWLDEVGRRLAPARGGDGLPPGVYRKLAAFWGPLDEFLFVDADVVVTCEVSVLLEALARSPAEVLYMHDAPPDAVYARGSRLWERSSRAVLFNTGVWAATRGLLGTETVAAVTDELEPYKDEILHSDQTVICHLLDRTGIGAAPFASVEISTDGFKQGYLWAGSVFDHVLELVPGRGGPLLRSTPAHMDAGITHWAGCALAPTMPYRALWRHYRWPGRGPTRRMRRTADVARGYGHRCVRKLSSLSNKPSPDELTRSGGQPPRLDWVLGCRRMGA